MLRGVLFKEDVLALVVKPMHYPHPSAAEWCDLFMTKFELCRLKNKDENDDDEKPDETAFFFLQFQCHIRLVTPSFSHPG